MNLLEHVKNGQYFCLKRNPNKIYKRIHNRIRAEGLSRLVVQVEYIPTGKIIDVERPFEVSVIPLGQ
jgi:hypothetical protein